MMCTTYLSEVYEATALWTIAPPPYIPARNELPCPSRFWETCHLFSGQDSCAQEKYFFGHCQTNLSDCNCQRKSKIFADVSLTLQQARGRVTVFIFLHVYNTHKLQICKVHNSTQSRSKSKSCAKCNLQMASKIANTLGLDLDITYYQKCWKCLPFWGIFHFKVGTGFFKTRTSNRGKSGSIPKIQRPDFSKKNLM